MFNTCSPVPANVSKRTFLAASVSASLAACGSGVDEIATTIDAGSDAALGDSALEKGFGRFTAGDLIRLLIGCKAGLLRWNQMAIDATGRDHKPVAPGENRIFGHQLGPCRASRAMAIAHIAIYDALVSITGGYQTISSLSVMPAISDLDIAMAQAGRDALTALFPSQQPIFDAALAEDIARRKSQGASNSARVFGIQAGKNAAAAILLARSNDGSDHAEPTYGVDFIPKTDLGTWSPDPVSQGTKAIGARWPQVRTFGMTSATQFRCAVPPALGSAEYIQAYKETASLGGDAITTPTQRTREQTFKGIFWAYDGTPSLCAPPRLYNQVATQISIQRRTNTVETARLLVLLNISMADAGIAAWESKFFYQTWRPVSGLRVGTDGNPGGLAIPDFTPLGAPASNAQGPNFTPPFPSYPSGHAVFGGAIFQVLRNFYGTDNLPFILLSDEYNGRTVDALGNARPFKPVVFAKLSDAEEENGQSRMYLGIHWGFDKTAGIKQGRDVANLITSKFAKRLK